ncbi:MAG TPA: homoserine O-acetyltransferase [Beijerinckiaceae bacterium]|nr:homoserine O-acetyltransferase [Beijerinckiaceae bacterium]
MGEVGLVEKQVFTLERFTTLGGATLKDVRVGWESYGRLNADKSNAVLVTHYFSGTSHAAGRYAASDPLPGYWDAVIGPGKAIDTEKYFIVSSDTLTNLNAYDPNVVTTGPASIDPDTGRPYGLSFPVVQIGDFVNVQKALVESLGITRLKAVAGPSMGALQAYEWAATYPEMVERIVPVIGAAGGDPFLIAWLGLWAQPIRLDPKWNGGDYYGREAPLDGVRGALKVVVMQANQAGFARETWGRRPADPARPPEAALDNAFAVELGIEELAALRAAAVDANNFLYLVKANQLQGTDASRIRCPALLPYAPDDLIFPEEWVLRTARTIREAGNAVETVVLNGPYGHLNGLACIGQAGPAIARFLER